MSLETRPVICGCGKIVVTFAPVVVSVGGQAEPISDRAELVPGFVNARARHSSSLPWYVRGPSPSRASPKVRVPFVATCGCGEETTLTKGEHGGVPAARSYGCVRRLRQD